MNSLETLLPSWVRKTQADFGLGVKTEYSGASGYLFQRIRQASMQMDQEKGPLCMTVQADSCPEPKPYFAMSQNRVRATDTYPSFVPSNLSMEKNMIT